MTLRPVLEHRGPAVRLWGALYGAIWVVFLEFLFSVVPQGRPWVLYAHYALGFLIVPLAYYNYRALRQTSVPGRIKRIVSATFSMSILMAILGPLLIFNVGAGWGVFSGVTVWNLILLLHVTTAFGIITQMAAVAIAYDMWEEKEFLQETRPGEIPRDPNRSGTRVDVH
ncbi:MAG: hypothetical protein WB809_01340 [Thermoplasmata archaeon]